MYSIGSRLRKHLTSEMEMYAFFCVHAKMKIFCLQFIKKSCYLQRCKCKTHFKQLSYATTTTATFASATTTAASAKAFLLIEWHSFLAFLQNRMRNSLLHVHLFGISFSLYVLKVNFVARIKIDPSIISV